MQSSGLGNCVNFMSMVQGGRFPFLTILSMRGDFGEGNPWQISMGQAAKPLLQTMGFIVLDEAFDMWKLKKTDFDYSLDWDRWHVRDLEDMLLRDRNHPSVFMWSIGNEVNEQWDKNETLKSWFHRFDFVIGILGVAAVVWWVWRHLNQRKTASTPVSERVSVGKPGARE